MSLCPFQLAMGSLYAILPAIFDKLKGNAMHYLITVINVYGFCR